MPMQPNIRKLIDRLLPRRNRSIHDRIRAKRIREAALRYQTSMELLEQRVVLSSYSPGGVGKAALEALGTGVPFSMGATDTLNIDLGGTVAGTGYDQVSIANQAATFGGTLTVDLINNFAPAVGQQFLVVTGASTSSGTFAQVNMPSNLPSGETLAPVFTPGGLALVVEASSRPVAGQLQLPSLSSLSGLASFLGGTSTQFSGSGLSETVQGQTVTGSFQFGVETTNTAKSSVVVASISGASASLGQGLVSFSNGQGALFFSPSGVVGSLGVTVATSASLPVSLSGTFGFEINTTASAFDDSVTSAGVTQSVNVPAGPYAEVSATGATLTVSGQAFTGNLTLQAGTTSSGGQSAVAVGLSGLGGSLGGVTLSNGEGALFFTSGGVVGTASIGVQSTALGLSGGTVSLEVNTGSTAFDDSIPLGDGTLTADVPAGPFVRVEATGVQLSLGGQQLSVGDLFLETGTTTDGSGNSIKIVEGAVSGLDATVGGGGVGITLSNGSGGFELRPGGLVAAEFSGSLVTTGLPAGLSLGSSINFAYNDTGVAVDDALAMSNGQTYSLDFSSTGLNTGTANVLQFGGALNLQVSDLVSVSGTFEIQDVAATASAPATLLIGANNVNAFFGVGDNGSGTATSTPGATGLQISGGEFGLEVLPGKTGQPATYALIASGTASLLGVTGLTASGTVMVQDNNTGGAVNQTIDGVTINYTSAQGNLVDVGGSLSLEVDQSVLLVGGFDFQKSSTTDASGVTTDTITVGASDITAFLGTGYGTAGETGVKFTDGTLGLVINSSANVPTTYALDASGSAALELPGLTLGGSGDTLEVRKNTTGAAINETIAVPIPGGNGATQNVTLDFPDASDETFLGGTLQLGIDGFDLSGGFSFTDVDVSATETDYRIGAANVTASLMTGSVGFELTGGTLGLAIYDDAGTDTYALDATGQAALVGLPVAVSGNIELRLNDTGGSVSATITVPNPAGGADLSIPLNFAANDPTSEFIGTGLSLGVADVFTIGGDLTVIPGATSSSATTITVANPTLAFYANGSVAVSIGATVSATFSLGGTVNNVPQGLDLTSSLSSTSSAFSTSSPSSTSSTTSGGTGTSSSTSGTKLGPLSISGPSVGVHGFSLGTPTSVGGAEVFPLTFDVTVGVASATLTAGPVTAVATSISGSIGASLDLSPTAPYVSNVDATGQWDLSIGNLTVNIGSYLTLSASGLAFDPSATADQDAITFGSVAATLNVGPISATGSAQNFAITGAGAFVALNNFGVGLTLNTSAGLGLPSFLPAIDASAQLSWPNNGFDTDPTSFMIDTSFGFSASIGTMSLTGSVTGLEIDVNKVGGGNPIVGLGSVSASASGTLFGASITGTFFGGLIQEPSGDNVFYCGVEGTIDLADSLDLTIELGLSDLGPLDIYISAGSAAGIPLGDTTLELGSLYGSIDFDSSPLPTITDPRQLASQLTGGGAFANPSALTTAQWQAQLAQEVLSQTEGTYGYLFTFPSQDVSALVPGPIATSGMNTTIFNDFLAQGVNLTPSSAGGSSPTLTAVTGSPDFLVTEGSTSYLIDQQTVSGSAEYLVFQVATTLRESDLATLESATPDLSTIITELSSAGLTLNGNATVTPEAGGAYLLSDGTDQYVVSPDNGVLAVIEQGSMNQLHSVVKIEAGAMLYDEFIPKNIVNAYVNVIITTDGKFAVTADLNLFQSSPTAAPLITADAVFYADLSQVDQGKASLDLYLDVPLAGGVDFSAWGGANITSGDGQFQIAFDGGVEANLVVEQETILGAVTVTISSSDFTVEAFASLSLTGVLEVDDLADIGAYFQINAAGLVGDAELDIDIPELQNIGVDMSATGFFEVNTTSSDAQNVPLPTGLNADGSFITITENIASDTLGVDFGGTLQFAPSGVDLMNLTGVFYLQIDPNGLDLFIEGTYAPFAILDSYTVAGAVVIDSDGFAGSLALIQMTNVSGILSSTNALYVDLNTTGIAQGFPLPDNLAQWLTSSGVGSQIISSVDGNNENGSANPFSLVTASNDNGTTTYNVAIPAAPPVPSWVDSLNGTPFSSTAGPYFVIAGESDIKVGSFTLAQGDIYASIQSGGLILAVQASLGIGPLGSAAFTGLLTISAAGLVVDSSFDLDVNLGVLTIEGDATLQVNTTTNEEDGIAPQSASLAVQGDLEIAHSFTIGGELSLTVDSDGLDLHVDGTMPIYYLATLDVDADAEIFSGANASQGPAGLVLYATASLSSNSELGGGGSSNPLSAFSSDTTFTVALDTRQGSGVDPESLHGQDYNSYLVDLRGSTSLFGLITLSGDGEIEDDNGDFQINVSMNASLLFGVVKLGATGYFNSDGEFLLNFNGALNLGADGFGLFGSVSVTISDLDELNAQGQEVRVLDVSGDAEVKLEFLHITIAGLGLDIEYNSGTGEFGVTAHVKILFVSFNPHFTIGYLKPPPDYQLATLNAGGALTLNVGPNAGNRNVGQGQTGETVGITESGTGIFTVSDFGVSETCGSPSDPVTSINGNFTGDGNNVVVFSAPAGVTGSVPVNLTMNDNANLQGGDIAILDNVKVGDNSTVQGVGSLGTEITAGALAQVTLTGWSGPSSTTGSPTVVTGGNSTIDLRLAGSGFGVTTGGGTVYGTPYTDTIDTTGGGMIYGEGGSDSVTFSGGGNGLIDLRGNDTEGQLIDASGSTGNVTIYGGGGNNTIKGGSGSDTIYTGNGNNIVYDDNGDQSV